MTPKQEKERLAQIDEGKLIPRQSKGRTIWLTPEDNAEFDRVMRGTKVVSDDCWTGF